MTYDKVMAKAREMGCTHQHIRVTECIHCTKEWEAIATEAQKNYDEAHNGGA